MSKDFRVALLEKWFNEPSDVRHRLTLENCPQCKRMPGLTIYVGSMEVGCHGLWACAKTVQDAIVLWNIEVTNVKAGYS